MANSTKIPWDDYDDTNKMVGSQAKSKAAKTKSSEWSIWSDPKDSKLPSMKKGTYDWGKPFGKGNLDDK